LTVNENGRYIGEVLLNATSAAPINHMKADEYTYDGDFTFNRNGKQSEIDWCFANKHCLPYINGFKLVRDCPQISDHLPIMVEIQVKGDKSLDSILRAAKELNAVVCNHSKIPIISTDNTDMNLLENMIKTDINKCDLTTMDSNEMAMFLQTNIRKYGKIAKKSVKKTNTFIEEIVNNVTAERDIDENEIKKWKYVCECNDSKELWKSINMKGEVKA
jgi:hypothetical protein